MRRDLTTLILALVIGALALCNLAVEARIQSVDRELAERVPDVVVIEPVVEREPELSAPNS